MLVVDIKLWQNSCIILAPDGSCQQQDRTVPVRRPASQCQLGRHLEVFACHEVLDDGQQDEVCESRSHGHPGSWPRLSISLI